MIYEKRLRDINRQRVTEYTVHEETRNMHATVLFANIKRKT